MATFTFDEFVDKLADAYAMDIDDTLEFFPFELENEGEESEHIIIYADSGNLLIHRRENRTVEFDEFSRAFKPTAFDECYREDREISIRPLQLM